MYHMLQTNGCLKLLHMTRNNTKIDRFRDKNVWTINSRVGYWNSTTAVERKRPVLNSGFEKINIWLLSFQMQSV